MNINQEWSCSGSIQVPHLLCLGPNKMTIYIPLCLLWLLSRHWCFTHHMWSCCQDCSFSLQLLRHFLNTNTIYNSVEALLRDQCSYLQASKGFGYLFSRCLGRHGIKGVWNLSSESLEITQQLIRNKQGSHVTPGIPPRQGFCPISSENCCKFIITTHLWKFSTSSTVSGKTLPLVSGRSSTNPPAIKPSTASKQRHKELVSI